MKIKYLLFLAFIVHTFILIPVFAQEASVNVIPPSPNASSLAKFVESPVSLYNGTASAHIPLMSISNQEISLEFSLKYDGKGIMVAETPSSVGAGWSLSGGGIITRQVRGRPDERANGYLTFFYSKDFETSSSTRSDLLSSVTSYQNSEDPVDQEPDLYFVSFLGRSVKFVIDNFDKTPVLQSTEDLKINITYTGGNRCVNSGVACEIDRFEIIDEKGFRYYFGQNSFGAHSTYDKLLLSETNKIGYPKTRNEDDYRTSWHLLEIITPTNNKITFTYAEENMVIRFDKSDVKSNNSRGPDYETYITKSTHKQMVLDEIIFPDGKLKFDYHKSQREDLLGSYALVGIRKLDNAGSAIKNVIFKQEYVTSSQNNDVSIILLNEDPHSKKRLFLNQVISKNFNEGEGEARKYTFEYNKTKLPNRHSTSIDRWGYFNGASNSQNLAERGNNRNVVGSKAEAGILKKIIYPTGGEELFEYEDHIVFLPSYFEEIVLPDGISEAYKTINDGMFKAPQYYVPEGRVGKYVREFQIEDGDGELKYSAFLDPNNCTDIETTTCPFKVRIYFYSALDVLLGTHAVTEGSGTLFYDETRVSYFKVEVSNPNFTLLDRDDWSSNTFMLNFTWQERKSTEEFGGDIIGGGRRIRSITTSSENGTTKREFTYKNKRGGSTGILLGIPEYFSLLENHYGFVRLIAGQILNPLQPMAGYSQGGAVGYNIVEESIVSEDNSKNGTNQYFYSNYSDGGKYYRWPYHQPDDLSWARGILLKKRILDVAGHLKQEIDYQYKYFEDSVNPYRQYKDFSGNIVSNETVDSHGLVPYPPEENGVVHPNYHFSHDFHSLPLYLFGVEGGSSGFSKSNEYRVAFFYGGTIKLKKEIIKRYEYGNSIETQKTYKYPTTGHHQVLKETYTFPDGIEKEISYKYAHEKSNSLLIGKNMVAIPLQTITTKKIDGSAAKIMSNVETKYPYNQEEANDKTSGLPLPFTRVIYDLQNTNTSTTQITYDTYDANNGNLLQFSKNGEIPTSIIWGYNNTQPIAIVEGATYDQIPYLTGSINIINASNNDALSIPGASESALLSTLNNFRNHSTLKNFQITTITYDPLIGMRSLTPPNGITEFYEYDKGRLKTIKNVNGQILKEFRYRYRR